MASTFPKGARVVPSGAGRTAAWPQTPGTVTQKVTKHSVEVIWDGTHFGDEMELAELALAEGDAARKPPPTDFELLPGRAPRAVPPPTDEERLQDV